MEQVLLVKSVVKCVLAPDATVDSDAVRAIIDCPVECSWFDGPVVKCCNSEKWYCATGCRVKEEGSSWRVPAWCCSGEEMEAWLRLLEVVLGDLEDLLDIRRQWVREVGLRRSWGEVWSDLGRFGCWLRGSYAKHIQSYKPLKHKLWDGPIWPVLPVGCCCTINLRLC